MKKLILIAFLFVSAALSAQKEENFSLTNALIVGQMEDESERYSLEIALTEFFTDRGVKAVPSLNVLKDGSDLILLAEDSLKTVVKAKGIDTYMLVSVRGYDSRFKPSTKNDDFKTALGYGTLFRLYREEITNVSFEFFFYRNGSLVKTQLVRVGNVNSKETVIKRLKQKLARKMKKW
jgi:hypothetical protein